MSITVSEFEWDEYNVKHLQAAHPHIDPDLLEAIVREAKRYSQHGRDRMGKKIYSARGHGLQVFFNLKPGRIARIFSVRTA
jgi:hypothetical protein